MKRNPVILFVFAAALLLFLGSCNKSGSGSGEKVQLSLNVEQGHVQKIHYTMDQTITQKIMGMSQRVNQVTEMFIKQEVESVDDQGLATIKVTYERVKTSMETALTGKQTFDSDNEADKDSPLAAGYGKIVGKTFKMKADKQYRIVEVEGVEELMAGMWDDGEGDPGEDDEMENALKSMFGPEAMKRNLQQLALVYPDVLVGEGDTWGDQLDLAGEFGLTADITYKVANIDAELVVLDIASEVKTNEDASIDMGMMKMEYELNGEQTGTMELNRKTGMVRKSELSQDFSGKVKAAGMTIPMSIRSTNTMELY